MNIQPPVALRFHEINGDQIRNAKLGVCPHCPRPVDGPQSTTLAQKHTCDAIQFLQCSRCGVVVALEKS